MPRPAKPLPSPDHVAPPPDPAERLDRLDEHREGGPDLGRAAPNPPSRKPLPPTPPGQRNPRAAKPG